MYVGNNVCDSCARPHSVPQGLLMSLTLGRLTAHVRFIMGVASISFLDLLAPHVRTSVGGEVEEVQRQIKFLSSE